MVEVIAVCAGLGAAAGWGLAATRLGLRVSGRRRAGAMIVAAVLSGIVGWRYDGQVSLPATLWLVWLGVTLAVIDLSHRRLPDALVGTLFVGGVLLLGVAAMQDGQSVAGLSRPIVASGAVLVIGLLGLLVAGSAIGRGDVTFSAALALYLGSLGWTAVMLGFLVGAVLLAVTAVSILAVHGGGPHRRFAAGPALFLGAVTAVLEFAPGG